MSSRSVKRPSPRRLARMKSNERAQKTVVTNPVMEVVGDLPPPPPMDDDKGTSKGSSGFAGGGGEALPPPPDEAPPPIVGIGLPVEPRHYSAARGKDPVVVECPNCAEAALTTVRTHKCLCNVSYVHSCGACSHEIDPDEKPLNTNPGVGGVIGGFV